MRVTENEQNVTQPPSVLNAKKRKNAPSHCRRNTDAIQTSQQAGLEKPAKPYRSER